jgi:hypothetical protein
MWPSPCSHAAHAAAREMRVVTAAGRTRAHGVLVNVHGRVSQGSARQPVEPASTRSMYHARASERICLAL